MNHILTPLNHREIEYYAKGLSRCDIPDSFLYKSDKAHVLFDWIGKTGAKVFDEDLVMDYGTDCLRLYLLFENTPKEKDAPFYESWNDGALEGIYKFLGRYRRVILAASLWNSQGGYETIPKERIQRIHLSFEQAEQKIDKYIQRENTMPNRHNIAAALMELLNVLQKELKIGEIVAEVRKCAVDTAVPKRLDNTDMTAECETGTKEVHGDRNDTVTQICREFVMLMAPIACDLSKMLWLEIV